MGNINGRKSSARGALLASNDVRSERAGDVFVVCLYERYERRDYYVFAGVIRIICSKISLLWISDISQSGPLNHLLFF